MLEPLEWLLVADTPDFHIERARASYGQWTISRHTPKNKSDSLNREARIKFQPAYPEGEDYMSIRAKMDALEAEQGTEGWSAEKDALWRYCSPTEIGYAASFEEAYLLVERLHEGDDGLPEAHEILTKAGFAIRHEHDNWRGHFKHYASAEQKGVELILADDDVHLLINRGPRWVNLMSLDGDHLNDHIRKQLIQVPYPPQVKDYHRLGASFAVDLIELRKKRGGLLRYPLEGEFRAVKPE